MSKVQIRKSRSKGTLFYSANWEIVGIPGLHLRKVNLLKSGSQAGAESTILGDPNLDWEPVWWHFWTITADPEGTEWVCSDLAYKIEKELQSYRFRTRREALQALEAFMALEEEQV